MPSKLGFHLHDGPNRTDALQRLKTMRPSAVVVLDCTDLMNAAYDTIGAGPLYIFRQRGFDDLAGYIRQRGGVENAVNAFLQAIKPSVQALPWAYHSTFYTDRLTEETARFDALAAELAYEQGIRLCIGNFATGTPDPPSWTFYRPALEAAVKYSALVGLREYYPVLPYVGYGPNINIPDANFANAHHLRNEVAYPEGYLQPGTLVGRYRYLRDYCRLEKLPVQMVIVESGAGRVLPGWMDSFGTGLSGWRSLETLWRQFGYADAAGHYLRDIQWLDQYVYRPDPEVIAVCLYAYNMTTASPYEIGNTRLPDILQNYLLDAHRDQQPYYVLKPLDPPSSYKVTANSVRIRPQPSRNNKPTGSMASGTTFTATHYAFNDGNLWLKHDRGWTAYTPLENGNPEYDSKFLEGRIITTPRQDAAVNNFVGSITEVRSFLQAHRGQMFFIRVNPGVTPEGARRFSITTFPVDQARRILDQLHPEPGLPPMSPEAKNMLRNAGQL